MASEQPNHTLYHFPYSICSIMVRYTNALRGQPKSADVEIRMEEKPVDITRGEQLTEHYLCDINTAGEVPVLAPHDSKDTIPDSQEITKYLAETYPSLIPASHADEIKRLLSRLHDINFFSLSYTGKPQGPQASIKMLEKELDGQISDRYRKAINNKIKRINTRKIGGLEEDTVKANEEKVPVLMKEFEETLNNSPSGWCYGLSQPSALDAHLVVFIARMYDVKRGNLIPEKLKLYADKAMVGTEWKEVMQGRNTFAPS